MKRWRRRIELDQYHRDDNGFMRGNRPCTKILIHYVFTPKYRKDISKFEGVVENVRDSVQSVCLERNWFLENLAVEKDHVHLLVQLPPTVSISYAAQIIKGNVSKMVREAFPKLKEELSGSSFWGRKYFGVSVGNSDLEITKKYIENQGVATL